MISLQDYIYEVSSDLVRRAADKAKELSKTGSKKEREYRKKQAKFFAQELKRIKKEEKVEKLVEKAFPKNRCELKAIIDYLIEHNRNEKVDLNFINISKVTNFNFLFAKLADKTWGGYMVPGYKLNIDVSKWDISHVKSMDYIFLGADFCNNNIGISNWNLSGVESLKSAFRETSNLKDNISKWDVSNVKDFSGCFNDSDFNQNISSWNLNKNVDMDYMFIGTPLEGKESEWFNKE